MWPTLGFSSEPYMRDTLKMVMPIGGPKISVRNPM